ncbi:putative membrane insertase YidC/ALB3/OXA1/COX18 [Helianthus annuus]|nr:putative membrane insertase YidC/ALB3/OXA1/COX18 [Helianthus annuus]
MNLTLLYINTPSASFVDFHLQIPCFILGTASVRQMALDHHPGFESGGTLWFQNLIELPHGATGYIFPLLLASLHLLNVQVIQFASL